MAIRRVTQDNRGKKTAGVDGLRSLSPSQRQGLVSTLRLPAETMPVRRVWIPKPGKAEKRALGIPTMRDRAAQVLAKLALEPEWEAKFEPNSYGFRPGRSCHDAIEAIFGSIVFKPKYVLDADIASCFDRIDHKALLDKLNTYPALKRAIRAWLRSGVMDGGELFPTVEGTPQGGPLSPLLANVALHGLEEAITTAVPRYHKQERWRPTVVRYADDFVVLHQDRWVIERLRTVASEWLAGMGLELKPSKTRISHTLTPHNGAVGFDFLGFHVRQYPVGKTHSGRKGGHGRNSDLLGYKTIITPSREAVHGHSLELQRAVRSHRTVPQDALITVLNPMIRGWTGYYSAVASKVCFNKLKHLLYVKLNRWARRRHPKKPWNWVARKYWRLEKGSWDFATRNGQRLIQHTERPIKRHVKVRSEKSPYDGDWVYWANRMGRHPQLAKREATLLRWQEGKCAWCGLRFRDEDLLEVDHIIPIVLGGKDSYSNWQLLHRHCHDRKTADDETLRRCS